MTTISANTTVGIDLNPNYFTSPVVITPGVTVSNLNYPDAVYAEPNSAALFEVQNNGTITGSISGQAGTGGAGIYLTAGGSVTNTAGASITGYFAIEILGGDASVANYGSIGGAVKIASATETVINNGSIVGGEQSFFGVVLNSGGAVINEANGLIIGGWDRKAVLIYGAAGTVVNDGRLGVYLTPYPDFGGVYLEAGGSVTNNPGASIVGADRGVFITGGTGTVVNDGSIRANIQVYHGGIVGYGVWLNDGGKVVNTVYGSIAGAQYGVQISGATGVVVNGGIINGGTNGILLSAPGSVVNASTGRITGATGINLAEGGTLTDAGTIIGTDGVAVAFGSSGTYGDRLVLDPGFAFSGLVVGGASASNTLELASAASAGTVTGLGTEFLHFNSIVFDAGAEWSIAGIPRGLSGIISGFSQGDTIDLVGITANAYAYAGQHLTLFNNGTQVGQLDLSAVNATHGFALAPDGSGGTDITVRPPAPRDFDGNGTSDILWRSAGGNVDIWEMNGASVAGSAIVGFADPTAWQIAGTGDFNADGRSDILWQNNSGDVAIWEMNGFSVVLSDGAGSAEPANWSIAATGDFDGNGTSDILWRSTAGNVDIWEMNGASVAGSAIVGFADPTAWQIGGTGDFDGDGKSDILWQDTSGNVDIWEMNGFSVAASAAVGFAAPSWHIRGTGDFNGDGRSDILWQDSSGDVAIWEMNGLSVAASAVVGFADPTTWQIAGTGDYNGDGKSNILWRSTSGNIAMWQMNGPSVAASDLVSFADPSWHIVPPDNTGATTAASAAAVHLAPPG